MDILKMNYIAKSLYSISLIFILGLSTSSNASIINNIGGIDYEWLELSNTIYMPRDGVEALLTDATSDLYGYRYATRLETQALFESYMPYTPEALNRWETEFASGAQQFFNDFGVTYIDYFDTMDSVNADDGSLLFNYNMWVSSYFLHGSEGECGDGFSCKARMFTSAIDGEIQALFTVAGRGFDASWPTPDIVATDQAEFHIASLLVHEITPVPVPAAMWLFASGLIGLAGVAKRKYNLDAR